MKNIDSKKLRTLERVFKGVANKKRIEILNVISQNPDFNLDDIAKRLKRNYHTTSEHIRRLRVAGLINDRYKGKSKSFELSPFGKKVLEIIDTFLD